MTACSLSVVGMAGSITSAVVVGAKLLRSVPYSHCGRAPYSHCGRAQPSGAGRALSRQPVLQRRFFEGHGSGVTRQMQFNQRATEGTFANCYATTVGFNDFSHHCQSDAMAWHRFIGARAAQQNARGISVVDARTIVLHTELQSSILDAI